MKLPLCVFAFAAVASAQTFDVASVKPASGDANGTSMMDGGPLPVGPFNRGSHNPGRLIWTNIWLKRMIQVAYDFPPDRISGPNWLDTERFDVLAALPAATNIGDFRLMVQHLLANRFHLALHRETKEISGYVLTIAKDGPKIPNTSTVRLKRDDSVHGSNALMIIDDSGFPAPRPGNPIYPPGALFEGAIRVNSMIRVTGLNEPMSKVTDLLGRFAGMPVQDQTGLTGIYDLHLEFLPSASTGQTAGPGDVAAPGPDLIDAVQAQLGLKLTAKKVPIEMLIVDRAGKVPTAN